MPTTVTPPATRFVGIADLWGRHVWIDQGRVRRAMPQASDDRLIGFAWGRRGAGSRELARAMLVEATGNPMLAERLCRDLATELVADLPEEGFDLDCEEVRAWVAERAE